MADSVNMSLDEIIKKNQQDRVSRSRGRGGVNRGRGGGRGRGRGRGGGGNSRGRSRSRAGTPSSRQSRSQSRGPRGRTQSQPRAQSRTRSRSRQQRRSSSRTRSRSRSQRRGFTPKGRAGLEEQQAEMPQLARTGRGFRGGYQNRLRRGNSTMNGNVSIHSRLGVTTRRGGGNVNRPLAVAKRGILKRGRGIVTGNKYSNIGLRSDQILKEQQKHMLLRNNVIKTQTFTRSRNNSFGSASQLTISVANDFARRRRNSVGSAGYLNKQSLAQLNNQFGGYNTRRGPGSIKSMGSNRSNRSSRSIHSNASRKSTRSRGRGRGGNRGIGRKFVNKQILNLKLQKEIAAIQGKTFGNNAGNEPPGGIEFNPTPAATAQTLHQRFAST